MSVAPGTTLLHYRIVDKLGEGGMGAVWRADDTTLGRQVAIKVLPPEFAANPDRLARFEREAKLLASLNHPNIAAIYGLHEQDGLRFLAMELVDGEDLSLRIARGGMSVAEVVEVGKQVCDALEAAHDNGIVHRDLKPANVQRSSDGKVKVLDFGLAKALQPGSDSLSAMPTVTSAGTAAGVVVGTAAYMSPEQARGEAVDRRADVWAFGCLLFEMLASRRPFHGRSVTDLLAAVVRDEPDWEALPAATPPRLVRLLRLCLAKDPRRRLRHLGDAGLALDDLGEDGPGTPTVRPATSGRAGWQWPVLLALAAVMIVAIWTKRTGTDGPAPLTRTELRLPGLEGTTNRWGSPPIALSPDGRLLAYVSYGTVATQLGRSADPAGTLVVRSLDNYEVRSLPGTDGATGPFFSPDGDWLGFFADNELRKVAVSGQSTAQTLHRFETPVSILGATWTTRDSIVFGIAGGQSLGRGFEGAGLLEVPASGGTPVPLTTPDRELGEMYHAFPFALPDGEQIVFTVSQGIGGSAAQPAILSRGEGNWKVLLPEGEYGTQPHLMPSGQLVFASADRLLAAPIDLGRGELTRAPLVVVDGVHVDLGSGVTYFALSPGGSLLYLPVMTNRLMWVDRRGAASPILDTAGYFLHPRLSPDGSKIALLSRKGMNTDVWVVDVARKSVDRLTHRGDHAAPLWTVQGDEITYGQSLPDSIGIAVRRSDGSGEPTVLREDGSENWPMSWSPDGETLAFEKRGQGGERDIWTMKRGRPDSAERLLGSVYSEESPRISPNGRWLAFVTDSTGVYEVYVASYPSLDRRWQLSSGGGSEPVWGPDGTELFYRTGWQLFSVAVPERDGALEPGLPARLFEGFFNRSQLGHAHFDVAPDGRRFVMVEEPGEAFEQLRLVLGWNRELDALVAE